MRFWIPVALLMPLIATAQTVPPPAGLPNLQRQLAAETAARIAADQALTDALAAIEVPVCRGKPGGTCSIGGAACAYDKDCAAGTCGWAQAFARFVDNGNGTVTDLRTCLTWEKKVGTPPPGPVGPPQDDSNPHLVGNRYSWTATPPLFDGTAKTVFLKALNDAAFAGHTDWRLPTSAGTAEHPTGNDPEVESIINAWNTTGCSGGCIDPIFGPTWAYPYWTQTSYVPNGLYAYIAGFETGYVVADAKSYLYPVRAVRGGF